jgi:hypothetical protein
MAKKMKMRMTKGRVLMIGAVAVAATVRLSYPTTCRHCLEPAPGTI